MIIGTTLILLVVFALIYAGGQIDLSFMETDAKNYWRKENRFSIYRFFDKSFKNLNKRRLGG